MGHGLSARLSCLRVGLESCHLGKEHNSLALVLLDLLDLAPLWFYVIWEGFTQVLSGRWLGQPQFGSILPLQIAVREDMVAGRKSSQGLSGPALGCSLSSCASP